MNINDIFTIEQYDEAYEFVIENEGTTIEDLGGRQYQIVELPKPSLDELKLAKRAERDTMLKSTDIYMLSDYPVADAEREQYKQYRKYLRDYTLAENWWQTEPLGFDEWTIGATGLRTTDDRNGE